MINYTYQILGRSTNTVNGLEDAIVAVHWQYTGTDEHELTANFFSTTFLPAPSDSNFVEYDNVSDAIIFTWLEQKEDFEKIQQDIAQRLFDKANNLSV